MAVIAARQHGVVSRAQLREVGLSEAAIDRALGGGRLHRIFPGAYAVGHPGVDRDATLLAAVLASGEGSVLSHGTAASRLGLWESVPAAIDVIAPVQAGRKIDGVRRRFVAPPEPWERMECEGIPITTPSRAIVDVAGMVGRWSLSQTIEQAAVNGMLDVPEIDRILAGPRRRRGSPQLREILEDWRRYEPGTRVRSLMEAKLLPLLTRRDLPIPECNRKLRIGGETFEVDFLWREQRLVVETDGGRFHDNPNAAARDSHRNRVFAAAGYFIPRLTWEDLRDRPEATINELARLLVASAVP